MKKKSFRVYKKNYQEHLKENFKRIKNNMKIDYKISIILITFVGKILNFFKELDNFSYKFWDFSKCWVIVSKRYLPKKYDQSSITLHWSFIFLFLNLIHIYLSFIFIYLYPIAFFFSFYTFVGGDWDFGRYQIYTLVISFFKELNYKIVKSKVLNLKLM